MEAKKNGYGFDLKERATFCIIIFLITLNYFLCNGNSLNGFDTDFMNERKILLSDQSINIDGNEDLQQQATNNSWPGNGTRDYPFLIRNHSFNGVKDPFTIKNTDKYIIISDLILNNSINDGLKIFNSSNITVNNVVINNCEYWTAWIEECRGITINNITTNNYNLAGSFTIMNSCNIVVIHSQFYNSLNGGSFGVYNSNSIIVEKNQFEINGIDFIDGQNNIIENNIIKASVKIKNENNTIIKNNIVSHTINLNENRNVYIYSNKFIKGGIKLSSNSYNSIFSTVKISRNNTINDKKIIYLYGERLSSMTGKDIGQIILLNCMKINISDVILINISYGIQIVQSSMINMNNIVIMDVNTGIVVTNSDNLSLNNSIISNARAGINGQLFNSKIQTTSFINVNGNAISPLLNNTTIKNCTFINDQFGILAMDSISSSIHDNIFSNCSEYAIYLWSDCNKIGILQNIFLSNSGSNKIYDSFHPQVIDRAKNKWNSTDGLGNYWSDWIDPDSNEDGIVDEPRPINEENVVYDHYPISRINCSLLDPPQSLNGVLKENSIVLTWEKPQRNPFMAPFTYTLYRSENGAIPEIIGEFEENTISYEDLDVEENVEYGYYMISQNDLGTGRRSEIVTLELDRTPPMLSISNPKEGQLFNVSNITVSWEILDPSGIGSLELGLDHGDWISKDEERSHTFENLSDGDHNLTVRASDRFGNQVLADVNFTVDTKPPIVELNLPDISEFTNREEVEVFWNCTDLVSGIGEVSLVVDGSNETVTHDGKRTISFDQGEHTIIIIARDRAGFETISTRTFHVDTQLPELEILGPANNTLTNSRNVTMRWECSDQGSGLSRILISVDGITEYTPALNDPSFDLVLEDGNHTITLMVFDVAGNGRTKEISISIDTIAPRVIDHGPTGNKVNVTLSIWVRFSEQVQDDSVGFTVVGIEGDILWDNGTLFFNPSEDLSFNRTYEVSVHALDPAGNTIDHIWSFTTEDLPHLPENVSSEQDKTDPIPFVIGGSLLLILLFVAFFYAVKRKKKPQEEE